MNIRNPFVLTQITVLKEEKGDDERRDDFGSVAYHSVWTCHSYVIGRIQGLYMYCTVLYCMYVCTCKYTLPYIGVLVTYLHINGRALLYSTYIHGVRELD